MTGIAGFENLFRPLHFPLLVFFFFLPSCCRDNERANPRVWMLERQLGKKLEVKEETDSCDSWASLESRGRQKDKSWSLNIDGFDRTLCRHSLGGLRSLSCLSPTGFISLIINRLKLSMMIIGGLEMYFFQTWVSTRSMLDKSLALLYGWCHY